MADTITSILKLVKPEPGASPDTWGEKLNANMDKIDVGVDAAKKLADTSLQRGGTEAQRTASSHLFYADTPGGAIPTNKPHVLVTSKWVKDLINTLLPIGTIIMWYSSPATIPAGWRTCDGGQAAGELRRPDLRQRFIVGHDEATTTFDAGDTGGFATHTHNLDVDGHKLTVAQMPSHNHTTTGAGSDTLVGIVSPSTGTYVIGQSTGTPFAQIALNYTGGTAQGSVGAEHNHTGTATAGSSVPPYYAMIFIMKCVNV